MNQRTVVVHGATGTQGAPVARRLADRGWHVVGLARDTSGMPEHVTAAAADLADVRSLADAYQRADAVVVQLPLVFDAAAIDAHVGNVLEALKQAGAQRVVFNANSPLPSEEIGIPFVDGRVRLAAGLSSAAPVSTVVAPLFAYMENLAIVSSAERIRARGELAYPVPAEFPMPWLALDDLAGVVADVVDNPEPPTHRLVAGPEALRGPEAAAELATALGRDVRWVTIDHVEFESMLVPDLGPEAAAGIASFYAAPPAESGTPPGPGLVHGATTLEEWASRW
jgi:uncharacterized protein YbjT (DUF2867 family)